MVQLKRNNEYNEENDCSAILLFGFESAGLNL